MEVLISVLSIFIESSITHYLSLKLLLFKSQSIFFVYSI